MVELLCLMSWHGSWYTIDENPTGPRAIAMWLHGFFVKTCFFSSQPGPGGRGCTANAIQRPMFVTSCQPIWIKAVLSPTPRDFNLKIRHFHIWL